MNDHVAFVMLDIRLHLNGCCSRRAFSLRFLFFSFFFFSGFSPIPPQSSNHELEPAWGLPHFLLIVSCRSTFSIQYTHLQHWLLSFSLPFQPRSFHPSIVDFKNIYRCIAFTPMMQSIHPFAHIIIFVTRHIRNGSFCFFDPCIPSVAENRLGVDRIASEGASDDHIIGAYFFFFVPISLLLRLFVLAYIHQSSVHMLQLSISASETNLCIGYQPWLGVFSCTEYSVLYVWMLNASLHEA